MDQIREMRLFLKVVRLGSLSAAARDAGASAPYNPRLNERSFGQETPHEQQRQRFGLLRLIRLLQQ